MIKDFPYGFPIIVLLALIAAMASDYCPPVSSSEQNVAISIPQAFYPLCFIASYNPEAPELQTTTSQSRSISSSAAISTATASTTTTFEPSPSQEA